MKAALYDALHWQRWLNGKADAAAIARRFEPPTSQPWRRRFRCVCVLCKSQSFAALVPACCFVAHLAALPQPAVLARGALVSITGSAWNTSRRSWPPLSNPKSSPIPGRARKEGIIEHYRERMERVTAQADTSRHAESRGIPAVCTALAGTTCCPSHLLRLRQAGPGCAVGTRDKHTTAVLDGLSTACQGACALQHACRVCALSHSLIHCVPRGAAAAPGAGAGGAGRRRHHPLHDDAGRAVGGGGLAVGWGTLSSQLQSCSIKGPNFCICFMMTLDVQWAVEDSLSGAPP